MNFRQVSLIKDDMKRIIWLDDGKLQIGNWVKPKGFTEWWKIEAVYPYDMFGNEINRIWHVGGL